VSGNLQGNGLSVTVDEDDVKSVTVAVDGQETRLVFVEYSSFLSPHMAPVFLLYTVSQKEEILHGPTLAHILITYRPIFIA